MSCGERKKSSRAKRTGLVHDDKMASRRKILEAIDFFVVLLKLFGFIALEESRKIFAHVTWIIFTFPILR